jgi:lysophospholipase L1-like esterase
MMKTIWRTACGVALLCASTLGFAAQPWTLDDNVRYLSMGDSFAAGKGAIPVTQGFAYLLYQDGVFGNITNVTFANAAVPGVDSAQVLAYQVPPAISAFQPEVVTVYVGLNDMKKILQGSDPAVILPQLAQNLTGILCGLKAGLPDVTIIIGNFPDFPWISAANPKVRTLLIAGNQIIATVASACGAKVADVFTAFDGRTGLFLHDRNGASPTETHPTNLGYRVIEQAFIDAAKQ